MGKNVAKLFGAAILNALGKGVEGYGTGQKEYREYALKELTEKRAAEKARPSLERNVEAYMNMTKEQQDVADKLKAPFYGPQPPAGLQEASRFAQLAAKKNRTDAEEAEMQHLAPHNKDKSLAETIAEINRRKNKQTQ